jgi:hypothetical protein
MMKPEHKTLLKHGSVFPALSYLATGYLLSFFVSTFLGAYLATILEGVAPYAEAIRGGERVVAYAVVALVLVGAIFDFIRKRITKQQALTTVIASAVFF